MMHNFNTRGVHRSARGAPSLIRIPLQEIIRAATQIRGVPIARLLHAEGTVFAFGGLVCPSGFVRVRLKLTLIAKRAQRRHDNVIVHYFCVLIISRAAIPLLH